MTVKRKIVRDYRRLPPTKFHLMLINVKHGLTDNPHYPDSIWRDGTLRQVLFEKVDAFEVAYRLAGNGDRVHIRERDKLAEDIVEVLDEVAAHLEAASVRYPDALFTTGFTVTQERRNHHRTKAPLTSAEDFTVVNSGDQGKAVGRASTAPGAYNHEIHINRKDPSCEADWIHKAMFRDVTNMVMENLEPGNTFFRLRHHGHEGPGPWSPITSVTIS